MNILHIILYAITRLETIFCITKWTYIKLLLQILFGQFLLILLYPCCGRGAFVVREKCNRSSKDLAKSHLAPTSNGRNQTKRDQSKNPQQWNKQMMITTDLNC